MANCPHTGIANCPHTANYIIAKLCRVLEPIPFVVESEIRLSGGENMDNRKFPLRGKYYGADILEPQEDGGIEMPKRTCVDVGKYLQTPK